MCPEVLLVNGLILALESEAGRSQELKGSLDIYTVIPGQPALYSESLSLSLSQNTKTTKPKKKIKNMGYCDVNHWITYKLQD